MFRLGEDRSNLVTEISYIERNYRIQVDDILAVNVFTNEGERIIDPNFELQQGGGNFQDQNIQRFRYLVQQSGEVKIPVVGKVLLQGLTIDEAEDKLETLFDVYYKDSFVRLSFLNKRVIVLGASGGQIVELSNENMSLVEVLALAGGIDFGSKAQNVRVIRGALSDPEVFEIDLSTVNGMKSSIISMEPGDIVYVEPWRRPFFEILRDATPILSATTSLIAFVLLIDNLTDSGSN